MKPPKEGGRKRPDKAKKCQDKKDNVETVVKCTLQSLMADKDNKDKILKNIRERVELFSKRTCIASIALNKIFKSLFHNIKIFELQSVTVPTIDETFIRQLMLGTKRCHKISQTIKDFYNENPDFLKKVNELPRYTADSNTFTHGAKKYVTNFHNHLSVRLSSWIKSFVYSKPVLREATRLQKDCDIDKSTTFKMILYNLHSWPLDDPNNVFSKLPIWIHKSLEIQHSILGYEAISDEWLKKEENYPKMIRYLVFINHFLKNVPGAKLRNLAPLSSLRHHHITIDTFVLKGIVEDCKLGKCKDIKDMDLWASILKFKKVQSIGKGDFTRTIDTDGISVSVHFLKPKKADQKNYSSLEDLRGVVNTIPNVQAVSIDPGRSNIIFATWKKGEEDVYDYKRLTRGEFYSKSGIYKARKKTQQWQSEPAIKEALEKMSEKSPKGNSLESFNEYITTVFHFWEVFWNEYGKKRWSAQRLRLYGGKKRVLSNFCNELQEQVGNDKKIVVAYGSAKFAPGGKGEMSVPVGKAFKAVSERFQTTLVDEFRTSRIYWKDKTTVLQGVKSKATKKRVRGLLWCNSTIGRISKCLVNRDLNAAINILDCFLMAERPEMLKRGNEKLRNDVGITIPC